MDLKDAIKKNKLKEFAEGRAEEVASGDKAVFNATLASMVGNTPKAQVASTQDGDEN